MAQWAPQYSRRERLRLLAFHLAWAVPLFLFIQFGFFPWFGDYVESAHCHQYGSVNGLALVVYALFVGLPCSFLLVVLALEGRNSLRIWQHAQHPLPGEKVLKPTRYVYGNRARLRPLLFLVVMLMVAGLTVMGVFWAGELLAQIGPLEGGCPLPHHEAP